MKPQIPLLWLVVTACSVSREQASQEPDQHMSAMETLSRDVLLRRYGQIERPVIKPAFVIDSGWMSADSRDQNNNASDIRLPHTFERPDSERWYYRDVILPEKGVLFMRADDGAQLFLDGHHVRRLDDGHFPVNNAGKTTVALRVMNNAMSGGLKQVAFITLNNYRAYQREKRLYDRLTTLVRKANSPDTVFHLLLDAALTHYPDSNYIVAAETRIKDYPLLIGPVIVYQDRQRTRISVVREREGIVILRWGHDGLNLVNEQRAYGSSVVFEIPHNSSPEQIYYQVESLKTKLPLCSFASPKASDRFSFNVWADSQSGWEYFERHISNTRKHNDAFGIGVGDLVGNGSLEEEWLSLFEILSSSANNKPYYLVPGNHDYDGYYDDLIPLNFLKFTHYEKNYLSWQYGNAAFIALDPNAQFPVGIPEGSEQFRWLMQELETESWKSSTWRFLLIHQPPYSQGWYGYHGDRVIRDLIEPLLEPHGIDFVVSGHTHDYERLTKTYGRHSTTFLIVGGGGGALEPPESSDTPRMDRLIKDHHIGRVDVRGNELTFRVYDINDRVIDSVSFRKP